MKFSRTASVITAALMCAAASGISAYAENVPAEVETVFDDFNVLDVNGSIIVNLPENASAAIDITFDSPEMIPGQSFIYYSGTFDSAENSSYSFAIEGYGCEKDSEGIITDGREYTFNISVSETEIGYSSGTYTEALVIPDTEEDPGSWVNYVYNVKIVQEDTDEVYATETTEKTENGTKVVETELTLYIPESALKGDVNDDGLINAVDASAVLSEYALTSTGGQPTFTQKQMKAGDVNEDGVINAVDASKILSYYAVLATGGTPSWD